MGRLSTTECTYLPTYQPTFVLQHCKSTSHFTRPLARVWPVILRNLQRLSTNSLRSFPVNLGRFTTMFEVAIALATLERRLSLCLISLYFFLFLSLGFSGSSG